MSATASSSLSTSITIKITSPDVQLSPDSMKKEPEPEVSIIEPTARSILLKPGSQTSASTRRSRFVNGSSSRSKSLDNDKNKNRRRKLYKSQTLTSISLKARNRPIENGNGHGDTRRCDSARFKLFHTAVDQSPLWTTLTHARTLSDFTAESWLEFFV